MDLIIFLAILVVGYGVTVFVLKNRYFASEQFRLLREQIAEVVQEHNDIVEYISEIRIGGTFQLGESQSGQHAHLASSSNTSKWNYKRDRNVANYSARNVHNCGLQVVRNASADPLKYLMKYFNIAANEDSLSQVESLGESISSLESAISNVKRRESEITKSINPPAYILWHFKNEFMKKVGVELTSVSVPYPEYVFEYVSAGGNSSQKTVITLNVTTIDALVGVLSEKIKWKKSAAGQRALMTTKLREYIKSRDSYMCKQCGVGLSTEPNLLLEIDHIIPVSRGGLTTEENLQTLCWRCNRSKSNKIL